MFPSFYESPVDSSKNHRQVRPVDDKTVVQVFRRPPTAKRTLLEPLVMKPKAILIPDHDLHSIAQAIEEDEVVTGTRVQSKILSDHDG